jgi:hypothetical protein
MATINVKSETDNPSGWTFEVELIDEAGALHDYTVTLSWRDYDHWCRGQVKPSRVVESAFEFLLAREPAGAILRKFDCAVIRRYFSDVDRELPRLL